MRVHVVELVLLHRARVLQRLLARRGRDRRRRSGIESGVTIVNAWSGGISRSCRRSAASARSRASFASSTEARARSSASSLLSRSFSPILPTSNRPLLSVYSVSFTATLAVALSQRHLLRVEIEERVGDVAGDVFARLEIRRARPRVALSDCTRSSQTTCAA